MTTPRHLPPLHSFAGRAARRAISLTITEEPS